MQKNEKSKKKFCLGSLGRADIEKEHNYITFSPPSYLEIHRESPGKGFRHFLTKNDIHGFVDLLPEWPTVSVGLVKILLARGEEGCDGWYDGSVVAINAWERSLWRFVPTDYFLVHHSIFIRLGVEIVKQGQGYLCKFEASTIKAFQLLHVFLHELGHHYDKMTTRSRREASRGEHFAEEYARCYEKLIWRRYFEYVDLHI
jgi:hypothetical protein